MYTQYFGLREEPFADIADLRFFYANPLCQKAYTTLLSGIRDYKGFLLLTGEAGTGKTTILRRVIKDLEASSHSLFFDSTSLTCTSIDDLLYFICTQLRMKANGKGKAEKLQAFRKYLSTIASKGGTGVLVVDEAHHLSEDVLGGLRMLAPLDAKSERLLLQIVLVGPPELETKLEQPKLLSIRQRVALRCRVERFGDQEVAHYIRHRLAIAGCERDDLFAAEAVQHIATFSKGLPRLVNIICDNALFLTYGKLQPTVSANIIKEVVANLRLVPSHAPAIELAAKEQPPTPTVVSLNGHTPGATATATASQGVRFLTENVHAAFAVLWRNVGGYVASFFFLALLFGLFLVYGRQGSVSSPQGRKVERQRAVEVARTIVPPPRIVAAQPSGQEIRVTEQQQVTFMVNASQSQTDLRYTWLLDGQEQGQGNTWIYEARLAAGRQQIVTVQVQNSQHQTVERSWKIEVQSMGRPLVIVQSFPTAQTLTLRAGRSQDFTIAMADAASTDSVTAVWLLDGQEVARGQSWTLTPALTGANSQHRVTVTIRDNTGRTIEKQWTVTVEDGSQYEGIGRDKGKGEKDKG